MPQVKTTTPPDTPAPIWPYSHVALFGDVADFEAMNVAYAERFGGHRPARTVIGVRELPRPGMLLTMNLMAVRRG